MTKRKHKSDAFEAIHSAVEGMYNSGTIEKWETGAKRPSGAALKLLSVVQKHGLKVLR
jgi:DNA-binding transcriptional regulator YiaG